MREVAIWSRMVRKRKVGDWKADAVELFSWEQSLKEICVESYSQELEESFSY